uniref:ABC transporter substrate-binding protein n=1 Tax=Ndongobacter massiliensis TaxID=1871025 RepID=UPI0009303923|nr:ABC transporter substrate-binding protein [Ndongobacter massiliensis]
MRTLNMILDWFPNTIHAGMLLAQRRGYYAEKNLALSISGEVHGVLKAPETIDFVVGPEASILTEIAENGNIIGIASLSYRQDSGIISLKEAGIKRPKDLTGKRITHWTPAWFHAVVGELVNRDGGDYEKVEKISMDVGEPEEVLGKVADAIWIYKYWEYFVMKQAGYEVNYIPFVEYGQPFNYPAPAMAARRALVEKEPEVIADFLAATEKGYQDVVNEGPSVLPEIEAKLPAVDRTILVEGIKHLQPLLLDPQGRWGRIQTADWIALQDFLQEKGILGEKKLPNTYCHAFCD